MVTLVCYYNVFLAAMFRSTVLLKGKIGQLPSALDILIRVCIKFVITSTENVGPQKKRHGTEITIQWKMNTSKKSLTM